MKKLFVMLTLFLALCHHTELICMELPEKEEEVSFGNRRAKHQDDKTNSLVRIIAYDTTYDVTEDAIKNSGALKNLLSFVIFEGQMRLLDLSDWLSDAIEKNILKDIGLSKKMWEDVILVALKTGKTYTLGSDYSPGELIAISNVADFLEIPYLEKSALDQAAVYIKKNINTLIEKPDLIIPFEDNSRILYQLAQRLVTLWSRYVVFKSQSQAVNSVAFSPNSEMLASASDDHSVALFDVFTKEQAVTLRDHNDRVTCVAYSPTGDMLVSCAPKTIVLRKVGTDKILARFTGHAAQINSVAFSPDEKIIASASSDGTIKLWDIATQKLLTTLTRSHDCVNSVAFSPNGKLLASGSDDGITLWSLEDTPQKIMFEEVYQGISSVAFSHDGKKLAGGGHDAIVMVWSVDETSLSKRIVLEQDEGDVTSVAFTHDDRFLIFGSWGHTVNVWDVHDRVLVASFDENDGISSVACSTDGKMIAYGCWDATVTIVRVVDLSLRQALLALYVLHNLDHEKNVKNILEKNGLLTEIYTTFTDDQKASLKNASKAKKKETTKEESSYEDE